MEDKLLTIGTHAFRSRLLLGTGKYPSPETMVRCHAVSGTECVTVAVRRVDFTDRTTASFFNHIDRAKYAILPNTAACYTVMIPSGMSPKSQATLRLKLRLLQSGPSKKKELIRLYSMYRYKTHLLKLRS